MANILIVHPGPDFSVHDVFRGWYKALKKQGHRIMVYNTNERLTFYGNAVFQARDVPPCEHGYGPVRAAIPDPDMIGQMAVKGLFENCFTFNPDVVFFISAFFHSAYALNVIRARGIKMVILHTESPYQDEEQVQRGQFASLNLLNDPTNITQWAELGPVAYVPHSYDPEIHYPAEKATYYRTPGIGDGMPETRRVEPYGIDFSFIGTSFRSRLEFFDAMNLDGIDVVFGGNGWDTVPEEYQHLWRYLGHKPDQCVDNTEVAATYRKTKVGINFYRREGTDEERAYEGWSMGPREVEMAACGLFFVRDHRPESDETFPMLPAFSGPAEAEGLIRWYLKHDREREKAADQAHAAIADWTFDNRAREVAAFMERLGIW